jgi:hypothetical protein
MAQWSGTAFEPARRFMKECDAKLVVGQFYRLEISEGTSARSRAHYFARIRDIWMSLPDHLSAQYKSETALRKHALVATGWANSRQFIASDPREARRFAAFVRSRPDDDDEDQQYSIVTIHGDVVTELTPRSQKQHRMTKDEFQRSKEDVLNYLEALVGVERRIGGPESES